MKYSIGILTAATLIIAFALSACDNSSNKMDRAEKATIEAERDMEIAKAEVKAEFRIYKSENENRLIRYNRTIEEIKRDINKETDPEVRARHETKLDRYKTTQRELKYEMDNYEVSGRENWNDFRNSFSNRMDDLGDSLKDFFSTSRTASSRN